MTTAADLRTKGIRANQRDAAPCDTATRPARGTRPMALTTHARARLARRNLAPDAMDYVLAHGRKIHRSGVIFFFLGRRDMPPGDRRASWAARLEGTIVLVATDGTVITVYRNRHGLHTILRKLKYRLPEYDQQHQAGRAARVVRLARAIA